jgi:hypothetical protein
MYESPDHTYNAHNQVHQSLMTRLSDLAETLRTRIADTSTHRHDQGSTLPSTHSVQTQTHQTTASSQTNSQITNQSTRPLRLHNAQAEWKRIWKRQAETEPSSTIQQRQSTLTAENHRVNTSCGDLLVEKPASTTRLYSMNVNGLSLDRRGGKFDELCKITREVQADILCCQEHNLDTTRPNVRSVIHETARQHWSRLCITLGTTPTPFLSDHKPELTLTMSVGGITGRITSQGQEKWGRWTSQTI